jgi:ABC-2 type transport system permease protein
MQQILALAWAEVLHVVRDRATLAQVLVVPVIQLIVLSNAATFTVRDTPAMVIDHDRTVMSRGLADRLSASGRFAVSRASGYRQAEDALLAGDTTLVVTIPRGFEESIVRRRAGDLQLTINAEKGSAAIVVQSYARSILDRYAAELGGQAGAAAPPIDIRARAWFNPTLNYKHYMVPGILVSLVTLIGTLLTAQNIAREKELGTLEQLNVTPITRAQFIAAKLLPFWALSMLIFAIGLAVGRLVFGIPMQGSLLLLFGIAGLYLLVALAMGLLISTVADTQQQAMFVTFAVMMVYLLMSGLYTPVDSMPGWVQVIADATPIKHFVVVARAILMKGAGVGDLLRPLAFLAAFAAVMLPLAVLMYRKRTA